MRDDFHLFSTSQNKNGNNPTWKNMYYSTSTWWLCLTNANVKIGSRWPSWRPRLPFTVKIICMVNQVWVSLKTQATSSQELALGPVFWSIRELEVSGRVILLYWFIHKPLWSHESWTIGPVAVALLNFLSPRTFVLQEGSHVSLTLGLEGYSLRRSWPRRSSVRASRLLE